jgi:serine/threonine protein kinase
MCGYKLRYAGSHPSNYGEQDIYRGKYNNQDVCIKVLRIFHVDEQERKKAVKVTLYGALYTIILTVEQGFTDEILVWQRLRHPNILPFLGFSSNVFPDRLSLVSPWVAHGNVMEYLSRADPTYALQAVSTIDPDATRLYAFLDPRYPRGTILPSF